MTAKQAINRASLGLAFLCLAAAGFGWRALAHRAVNGTPQPAVSRPPLAALLNPDGTLKPAHGFEGSLDGRGWRLTATSEGAPRFVSAAPGDELWDAQFTNALGVNGTVEAIAVSGSDVYIGGSFSAVQGVAAKNIARWNGSVWSALGEGISGTVYALAVSGSNVYVGGGFITAGTTAANGIAVWNGSIWTPLGDGVTIASGGNGSVLALAVSGSDVYAAGGFTTAGSAPANNIARWNGSTWSALGGGLTATGSNTVTVEALAISGSDLYVGGFFSSAGGTAVSNIARWNGSAWTALGAGLNNQVKALAVSGGNIYVGGSFTGAGNVAALRIARWNGSAWVALGSGLSGESFSDVNALAVSGNDVFAGGGFTTAGGQPTKRVARWNGSAWSTLGSGIGQTTTHQVKALAVSGGELIAGGFFSTASEVLTGNLARWNGSAWSSLGSPGPSNSVNGVVRAIALSGNDVYVGGDFNLAGGVAANNIAKWNGLSWLALGSGLDSSVNAIAVSGNDVYVGGNFGSAGGVAAGGVAKWNGSTWSALGNGLRLVGALAISSGNVYAGGSFTTVNGTTFNNIAVWNGSTWAPLGSGVNGQVLALAVSGNDVYAGGTFTTAGGNPARTIAKWNGSAWTALTTDVGTRQMSALVLNGNDLYAGGFFTSVGVPDTTGVAKWNGSVWAALGSGIPRGFVFALALQNNALYAGGSFLRAGDTAVNNLAKWDGGNWSALGSGVNSGVSALAANASYVYAGGSFATAGGKPSHYFGRYQQPCTGTLSAASQSFPASGGAGSVNVTAPACNWTAVSNAPWATITSGATGSGNGTVNFTVTANPDLSTRTATLTIAGQSFSLTQAGQTCSYTLAPTSATASASGGTGSATVTPNLAACAWTATSNAAFITITSGASGMGTSAVNYTVAANPNPSTRTGTLTIAGLTFTVTQEALACSYTLTPASLSVAANGGTGSVAVAAANGCAWMAASNDAFITLTGGASGNGNGTVAFTVAANPAATQRTGTLTIAGQTFTVTQAGQPCSYTLTPANASVPASGGGGTVAVAALNGCAWTATSNAAFITVTSGASGNGNGTVAFSVAANPTTSARTGTLTIAGQTFTVTQAALLCDYAIAPTSQTVSAAAGTGSVAVTTTSGCTWTATSNVNWLTITSGASGSGNGSVSFTIAANPSTSARNGTLTIAGLTATVNQSGAVTNRLVRLAPAVGAAGSTVNVPVELVAQGDETALSFSLGYDQALLSNPSATASADASGATLSLNLDQVAQGRIGLRLTLPAGQRLAAGTRQLALITFTLAAAATGPTALNFGDIPTARLVADSAANPLPANYLGGSVAIAQPVASVSAASFSAAALAPEAMVAAFGTRLATRVEAASTLPLPTSLAGTSLRVRDGAGTERLAPLFFVAPGQINYLVPAGTALGTASLTVTSGDGALSLGTLNITSVAPGLFAANANGQGVPAAVALRVKADGAQSFEPVAVFDPARNQFVAVPLDVSAANERVFLILFGTGFRFNSALAAVSANSGGTDLPVSFAGAAGELAGLDQLNVELPRSLSGRGELNLTVTVDGRSSNTLRVLLK